MKLFFTILLASYPLSGMSSAHTYWHRFVPFVKHSNATQPDNVQHMIRSASKLVKRYPWLLELHQPTVTHSFKEKWYPAEAKYRLRDLPQKFYSTRQTIYNYDNDQVVQHVHVSPMTPDYEKFRSRVGAKQLPIVVTIGDKHGRIDSEYLYTERPLNHLANIFAASGFSFATFLANVQSPLLNIASGGFRFASHLRNQHKDSQYKLPKKQRRWLDVFSLDISGSHRNYQTNPWYLFGDMYATGLPDDTFGAVTAFGGPLRREQITISECAQLLTELGRITNPRGRLLIEITMATPKFLAALDESGLNYRDYLVYQAHEYSQLGDRVVKLIEILLDKDYNDLAP